MRPRFLVLLHKLCPSSAQAVPPLPQRFSGVILLNKLASPTKVTVFFGVEYYFVYLDGTGVVNRRWG